MSKRQLRIGALVVGGLVVAFFATSFYAITALAQGAPASQPVVVAPVSASGGWAWFLANSQWIIGLAVAILSTLATGLSDYPTETPAGASRLQKVVRCIRIAVALLGVVQFRNAPGSLKAPLAPPAKP